MWINPIHSFLNECLELTFLEELILIKQLHQKSAIFVIIAFFLNKAFKFQSYVCNGWHGLLIMSMSLSGIAILSIKGSDNLCIISGISKSEAINLMQNIDLTEKSGTL